MRIISRRRAVTLLLLVILAALFAAGATAASSAEAATERYFQSIRKDPNLLLVFLREMPKGGDLHNHLTGSVYAESFIPWAAEAGDCVDSKTTTLSPGPCAPPLRPVSDAFADQALYNQMIDAFSMRNWQYSGQSGHDHFFDTFGKYWQAWQGKDDKLLADSAEQAAANHVLYQELMMSLTGKDLDDLAKSWGEKLGWDDDFGHKRPAQDSDFRRMQNELMAGGLPAMLTVASQNLHKDEERRDLLLGCGTPQARPGCEVEQRFLEQVARGKPKAVVFGEILAGFLMAGGDSSLAVPHVVSLNLVMAEDWYVPMTDFSLHMQMLDYLHRRYPNVHVTLHAGELVMGLVPPEDLRFHIRESVELGHAERIGHGVDIMNEKDPQQLLREMADRKVMVEICLTSNDVILGVTGKQHPLSQYIRAGVPVALATDDEGVARSDMTHEYLRGAQDQELSYLQLKKMARTSLEHAFLPGASLWREGNDFVVVKQCAGDVPGGKLSPSCQKWLKDSEKARLQWKLEEQFREFEAQPRSVPAAAPEKKQ